MGVQSLACPSSMTILVVTSGYNALSRRRKLDTPPDITRALNVLVTQELGSRRRTWIASSISAAASMRRLRSSFGFCWFFAHSPSSLAPQLNRLPHPHGLVPLGIMGAVILAVHRLDHQLRHHGNLPPQVGCRLKTSPRGAKHEHA